MIGYRRWGTNCEKLSPSTVPDILEIEIAIEKLKKYTASDTDEIPAELIKRGGNHYLIRYIACFVWFGKGSYFRLVEGINNHTITQRKEIKVNVITIEASGYFQSHITYQIFWTPN